MIIEVLVVLALVGVVSIVAWIYRYVRLTTSKKYQEMLKNQRRYLFLAYNGIHVKPPSDGNMKWSVVAEPGSVLSQLGFEGSRLDDVVDKMMEYHHIAHLTELK